MKEAYLEKGRRDQKKRTRNKLLEAAHSLLREGAEFTLEAVAERAGVSRATAYRYYSNKDVLSAEAVLDMRTRHPDAILDELEPASLRDTLAGIQRYYNSLTAENEAAFRTYLSVILSADNQVNQRGARRVQALERALHDKGSAIPEEHRERFVHLATLLMGIEAYIVMKDVCGLDAKTADATLEWGLQCLLKGVTAAGPSS